MELPDFLQLDVDQEVTLKGHRIRVMDVAARYLEGHSAEGIAFDIYPTLDLPLVYKAIGFFLDHETEYRRKIEHNAAELSRQAALPRNSPTVAELRRRMNATRPAEAS